MAVDFLKIASAAADMEWVRKHAERLNELERSGSNSDFKASTDYVLNLLREAGFSDIERYALPCDGVTSYDDCTMPQAWDRTGRSTLEMVDPALSEAERMIADTDIQPLSATIWSVPTPPGGVTAPLVSLQSVQSEDWHEVKGKIVLCDVSPNGDLMRKLAMSGALGLVSFVREISDTNPDDVRWMNGPGLCGWYYLKDDLRLWNFSITPRRALELEKRLAAGNEVILHAVMNTRVYDGEIYTVTARIPGHSAGEIALFAHMYEPFIADDATGVVLSIAIGKALRELVCAGKLPALEKSVRVVFGMERYGFSEYFHNRARSRSIIAAVNMDSVCHSTLELAGVPLELRHSSAAAPFFGEILIRDYLLQAFPQLAFRETAGNLSDDTFGADPGFNIPTNWLFTPPAPNRHHNSGAIFAGVDWSIAAAVWQIATAYLAQLATVRRGAGDAKLLKQVLKGVKIDLRNDFKRLAAGLRDGSIQEYARPVLAEFLIDYHTRRVSGLNRLAPGAADIGEVRKIMTRIAEKIIPQNRKNQPCELTTGEARMAYLRIRRDPRALLPMSLGRLPEPERHGFVATPCLLLCALLDGQRTLWEANVIANFMLRRKARFSEPTGLVQYFKKLEAYGYCEITEAPALTAAELEDGLQALGVKHDDALVVHSAFSSLGGVVGGPRTVAETLARYCGKNGVLMMPSFNFPYYMGRSADEYFDVAQTPSCVGAVTEEFRKLPGVVRSLNPSHSMAVFGRKNFAWIADHHRTLTMGADSPLGKLEKAGGYALMIGCSGAVTFMHVVETTNRVHCLGYRNEEFQVKLPDGRIVPVRTWGWRSGSCRGYSQTAIFDWLRKHRKLREVMVRHSCWRYFKLSDYRKAYEKVVLRGPRGCMQCPNLPRVAPHCVPSDWDWDTQAVRPESTAFTGDWQA